MSEDRAGLGLRAFAVLLAAAGAVEGVTLVRGPYLQLTTDSSIVIVWRTDEASNSVVEFSGEGAPLSTVEEPELVTEHVVALEGLLPAERYVYRVSSGGQILAEGASFRTAPLPGAAGQFRVVAFGDSGGGTQAQLDVAARIEASQPDFLIHVGDIAYPGGSDADLDRLFFGVYRPTIAEVPAYIALGNKDVESDAGAALLAAFHAPPNSPDPERYYSFVYGHSLWIALDTNQEVGPGSAPAAWLESELSREGFFWKIVYFHHPMYSSSGGEPPHRAQLEPLFLRYGVDLVFQGHTHYYERTFPMDGGNPTTNSPGPEYVNPGAPIYVVTGGGGGTLITANPKPFSAVYASRYHHVELKIEYDQIALTAIDREGAVIDSFSVRKIVPEDCCNLRDDDFDGRVDFSDTDCANHPECGPAFQRGDSDGNGALELTDAVKILGFLFLGSSEPPCLDAADTDDSGDLQLTDAVRILGFLFLGGEPPAPPGPPGASCGPDGNASPSLGCLVYSSCP
ncbi:MAG TPA: metallophosphoesterase family protein [Planctomycetota bacterium]|nr:metallophosphoesterase family protein [Planctomycetota bacterium]